jgi:hypothetical protein
MRLDEEVNIIHLLINVFKVDSTSLVARRNQHTKQVKKQQKIY